VCLDAERHQAAGMENTGAANLLDREGNNR